MDRYNVVFRGEYLLGCDIDEAKDKLAQLFKLDDGKLDALFSGESVTVSKDVTQIKGEKIIAAAARCGVVFELEEAALNDPLTSNPEHEDHSTTFDRNVIQCPHCGTQQGRAATCLHCGEFLIQQEAPPRSTPIETVSVEVTPAGGKNASHNLFKTIRVAMLLFILLIVGLNAIMSSIGATNWDDTLWVGVYPINADDSEVVDHYIHQLDEDAFLPISEYFIAEAERYDLPLAEPAKMLLAPEVKAMPPAPPSSGNPMGVMWWSLKMRWWVFRSDTFPDSPSPEIKIFVIYHAPNTEGPLENSLGIRKGMFGVVHAYADFSLQPKNHVVIAHEILHTLGASDKYNAATQQPTFPDGFADPDRSPPYPQQLAEIMGSRIPHSEDEAIMPPSLDFTIIGNKTAREIKWLK